MRIVQKKQGEGRTCSGVESGIESNEEVMRTSEVRVRSEGKGMKVYMDNEMQVRGRG